MDKEKMKSLMIEHIDGTLSGELSKYVENHIQKDKSARKEYEELKHTINLMHEDKELDLPVNAKLEFMDMLKELKEQPESIQGKVISIKPSLKIFYQVAAAIALVVIGFGIGKFFVWGSSDAELQALRDEIRETKELILVSMMQQESASERLKGVLASNSMQEVDNDILGALIHTMNNDDNINVRVAAIEALDNFSDLEMVRQAFVDALSSQEYPIVQLKLIDILVSLGEKRALDPMRQIIDDETVIVAVKDEAQMGIFKLM